MATDPEGYQKLYRRGDTGRRWGVRLSYEAILNDGKPLAIQFLIDGKPVWIPRKCCMVRREERKVTVVEWLAASKGLIGKEIKISDAT